jgi:hypothetical protein
MIKITLTETSDIKVGGLNLFNAGINSISLVVDGKITGNNRYSSAVAYYNKLVNGVWIADKTKPIKASDINIKSGTDYKAKTLVNDVWVDTYEEDRGGFTGVDGTLYNDCNIHKQIISLSNPSIADQMEITVI